MLLNKPSLLVDFRKTFAAPWQCWSFVVRDVLRFKHVVCICINDHPRYLQETNVQHLHVNLCQRK